MIKNIQNCILTLFKKSLKYSSLHTTVNMPKVNDQLLDFLSAGITPQPESSGVAYRIDADVIGGVDALYRALDGRKPKARIVNDILRAAIFSDAINEVLAVEGGA